MTVGGSIQGLAAESSSLTYGFVHDIVQEFQVVLGNGDVIWCSQHDHSDLFHALPGSYGSLGILTRVKIGCIRCYPHVLVTATCHSSVEDCVDRLTTIQDLNLEKTTPLHSQPSTVFAEGIVYNDKKAASIIGKFLSQSDYTAIDIDRIPIYRCNVWGGRWFFNQINDLFRDTSLTSNIKRYIRLFAVLIAGFATVLAKQELESTLGTGFGSEFDLIVGSLLVALGAGLLSYVAMIVGVAMLNLLSSMLRGKELFAQHPQASIDVKSKSIIYPIKDYLFRHDRGSFWMASYRISQSVGRILGSLLDSSSMFLLASLLPWMFPKQMIVLQDLMLPRSSIVSFVNEMEADLNLYPLWLLPMRSIASSSDHRPIFSIARSLQANQHLVNVGMYGIPKPPKHHGRYNFIRDNIKLEHVLKRHEGRKVFYSHAFYDRKEFYEELYDGKVDYASPRILHLLLINFFKL
jgi:hypothetical protein